MIKSCPYHFYDIQRVSRWLNKQALQGWKLENWGVFFIKFRKSTSQETGIYQIDMDDKSGDPDVFRKEELSKYGWEYVTCIGTTRMHIYYNKDRDTRLPRNEAKISFNLKKLNSELFWSRIIMLSIVVFFVAWLVLRNEFLYLQLLQQSIEVLIFYGIWILLLLCNDIGLTHLNKNLYNYLDTYDHTVLKNTNTFENKRDIYFPAKLFMWIMFVMYVISLFYMKNIPAIENLKDADASLKYIDLADIENGDFILSDISWEEYPDVNFGNRIEYKNVPLTYDYYEIDQYGESKTSGQHIQMHGVYWNLKKETTAKKLFDQLVECSLKYPYEYSLRMRNLKYDKSSSWIKTEISDDRFTKLVVADGIDKPFEGDKQIFAWIENKIIFLKYFGNVETEILIEKIAEEYI